MREERAARRLALVHGEDRRQGLVVCWRVGEGDLRSRGAIRVSCAAILEREGRGGAQRTWILYHTSYPAYATLPKSANAFPISLLAPSPSLEPVASPYAMTKTPQTARTTLQRLKRRCEGDSRAEAGVGR